MNTIREKINQDLKEAMKNGDNFKRDTLRLLNSAFKQVEVDQRIALKDSDIIKILKTAYKQRDDAAMAYKNAGRNDLFEKETKEMEIITSYLPKQLDDVALRKAIEEIITSLNAGSKDMGKVMQEAKNLNADGKRISAIAKELLQKA
ncbi:GatB/YqeY domain-containing protein [Helicobacter sp. faydin-H20]|uniref:GatB/YqeY domain-containing protein n=1 Tax=Helicobacter anatolicus TaxID=2905874 RepID=UPI001E33A0C3|nr:GatB/YqeY domain-containing protein [Helicobacter anatolicus]MCE3036961.1 GatB/YqeY domain-containing protein [Helicobacter anatolicus]